MEKIFEVRDKTGRLIYLPKTQWLHIASDHPTLANKIEWLKEAIIHPLFIKKDRKEEDLYYYHRRYKENKEYVIITVKYLNGAGFIITGFWSKNIKQ